MQKLKDKKIRILVYSDGGEDADGFPIAGGYKPIHTGKLWAYYRHTSAKEYYAAMALQEDEEAIFVINWRTDIDPAKMIIEYNGKYYDINRIDNFEGYKNDITIYGKYTAKTGIVLL